MIVSSTTCSGVGRSLRKEGQSRVRNWDSVHRHNPNPPATSRSLMANKNQNYFLPRFPRVSASFSRTNARIGASVYRSDNALCAYITVPYRARRTHRLHEASYTLCYSICFNKVILE